MNRRLNIPARLPGEFIVPESTALRARTPPSRGRAYGDWLTVSPEDATHFVPDYLGGSDYSGGVVERSNFRTFMREYGEVDGVLEVYGAYGTYAVAIPLDLPEEISIEIESLLESLTDYPVIDEGDLSEYSFEREREEWDSWAASDYVRELAGLYPALEDALDDASEDAVREIFESARESANVYWEAETGGGMHIDIERVAQATPLRSIVETLAGVEVRAQHEHVPVEGFASSIDEETDAKVASWIHHELEQGNLWAWCIIEVRAVLGEYSASDYLSCCSYESEEGFRSGGYFDAMKYEAIGRLCGVLELAGLEA